MTLRSATVSHNTLEFVARTGRHYTVAHHKTNRKLLYNNFHRSSSNKHGITEQNFALDYLQTFQYVLNGHVLLNKRGGSHNKTTELYTIENTTLRIHPLRSETMELRFFHVFPGFPKEHI
jgi:hypothetical protein